jgi:hypothetical protein
MAPAELEKMFPELAGGGGVEFLQRDGPCRLLAAFVLAPVESRVDLVVRGWRAFFVDGTQVEERGEGSLGS